MPCPRYVGRTDATLGNRGPYPNASKTELLWAVSGFSSSQIYRYAYPVDGSPAIEVFNVGATYSSSPIAPAPDGSLWFVTTSGEVYRRALATGVGSNVLMATIPGGTFTHTGIVWSDHDENFYVLTSDPAQVLGLYRVTPSGVVTDLTAAFPTLSVFASVRAAGGSIWIGNIQPGFAVRELVRYSITDGATEILDPAMSSVALAATDDGRILFMPGGTGSDDHGPLAAAGDDGIIEIITCSALYAPNTASVYGETALQGGATVPGDPTSAVMSHYVDYTGEPDADWVWEWPALTSDCPCELWRGTEEEAMAIYQFADGYTINSVESVIGADGRLYGTEYSAEDRYPELAPNSGYGVVSVDLCDPEDDRAELAVSGGYQAASGDGRIWIDGSIFTDPPGPYEDPAISWRGYIRPLDDPNDRSVTYQHDVAMDGLYKGVPRAFFWHPADDMLYLWSQFKSSLFGSNVEARMYRIDRATNTWTKVFARTTPTSNTASHYRRWVPTKDGAIWTALPDETDLTGRDARFLLRYEPDGSFDTIPLLPGHVAHNQFLWPMSDTTIGLETRGVGKGMWSWHEYGSDGWVRQLKKCNDPDPDDYLTLNWAPWWNPDQTEVRAWCWGTSDNWATLYAGIYDIKGTCCDDPPPSYIEPGPQAKRAIRYGGSAR